MSQRLLLLAALLVPCPALAQTAPAAPAAPPAKPFLSPLFTDHAVLQRDTPLKVWGWAPAKTGIAITLDKATVKTRADKAGRWEATLPAHTAGGPYTLYATGSDGHDAQVTDVMLGDVWLCSGQSNMQFPLKQVSWDNALVTGASDANIRLFTVPVAAPDAPTDQMAPQAVWATTSPATAADFSAACFLMGRELAKTADVTMGLIHASRGGSAAEAWLSPEALKKVGGFDAGLGALRLHARSPARAEEAFRLQLDDWWTTNAGDGEPAAPDYDDSGWGTTDATKLWESWGDPSLEHFDGIMWYRLALDLTPEQVKGAAILHLGAVDDYDLTAVNGERVGSTRGWDTERSYRIRDGLLKPGRNIIAVRVLDTGGGGGMSGDASSRLLTFADGTTLPIEGQWRWQKGPALSQIGQAPTTPWDGVQGLTTLYNGMIRPIEGYAIKGVAWYQGESNVGRDVQYATLLAGLVADWRQRFGAQPWVVVQLAGYGAPASQPTDPAVARLREAQRTVVAADKDAALASAIDIGDPINIHPVNKVELARRMAIAARQVAYGEKIDGSGPMPVEAQADEGGVTVRFETAGHPLVVRGGAHPTGFELCDEAHRCTFTDATLDGASVHLIGGKNARFVRYLWSESPVVDLYDGQGLPVPPFETAVAPGAEPPPPPVAPPAAMPAP